jgi:TrmH family RNA methyltransferase
MVITSAQNPRVKTTLRLREGRYRRRQGLFAIDGLREIDRAIRGGISIQTAFFCPERYVRPDEAESILARLQANQVEQIEVHPTILDKMAFGDRAEGILAVAQTPDRSLASLILPTEKIPLLGVVERIEKPGNVGAVLRSADGAGLDAVIVADPQTDLFNPNTIRSSLGTVFTLPVVCATTDETLTWLREHELAILAARVDGSIPYTEADYSKACAIVLGAEATGLSEAWAEANVGELLQAVRLPMLGLADSLNISAAAAVLFYEALRQRSS